MKAIDHPAADREAWIVEATQGDPLLAAEVRSLLAFHTEKSILPSPELVMQQAMEKENPTRILRSPPSRNWTQPAALVALGLILVLVAALVYLRARKAMEAIVTTGLTTVLESSAAAAAEWIGQWEADLTYLVRIGRWDQVLAKDGAGFGEVVNAYLANHPGTHAVLVRADGGVAAASERYPGSAALTDPFRKALRDVLGGATVFLTPTREAIWPGAAGDLRVWVLKRASPEAVLMLSRSASEFDRVFLSGRAGKGGDSFAFSGSGYLITDSRFSTVLRAGSSQAPVPLRDPGFELSETRPPPADWVERPYTTLAQQAIPVAAAGQDRSELILKPYRNHRGAFVLGGYRWLPQYGFGIGVEFTAAEAFAPVKPIENGFLLFAGLLALTSGGGLLASFAAARWKKEAKEARQLGQYTLGRQLGSGGMGEVYLARHALLKRPAAVKVVRPDKITERSLERFEREVQVAADLRHPNTIEVYDFGRATDGTFFCAMEYVAGLSLADLAIAEGPLPPARVIHLMIQACASLEEAHSRGVLHRDIKPGNLMACILGGQYDWVKVLDFGLAKSLAEPPAQQANRLVAGTPLYMAPERFLDPDHVDERSDLFSLGAVAYRLLAGCDAFESGPTLFEQIATRTPATPSHHAGRPVPRQLEAIVYWSLEKEKEKRPASAAELRAALQTLAGSHPWTQAEAREWWESRGRSIAPGAFLKFS